MLLKSYFCSKDLVRFKMSFIKYIKMPKRKQFFEPHT